MSKVIPFPHPKTLDTQTARSSRLDLGSSERTVTAKRELGIHMRETVRALPPAEKLESSLDDYRSTMLELAHRRQEFEMQMLLENNTAQIKLEAAGYKALMAGVPENDIYALGEDMAEALESAMNTVAGA